MQLFIKAQGLLLLNFMMGIKKKRVLVWEWDAFDRSSLGSGH